MPWLELSLTLQASQQPRAEAALEELGALSVTLRDADAETPDEQAIFEPGVGELPLWASITMQALFEDGTDQRGLSAALHELLPALDAASLHFSTVEDQDWERVWMDQYQPMQFGQRLWIYPWNIEPPDADDTVVVRLDPGLAFGSGTHPTTALCLEWLDAQDLQGRRVIDFGCGSGILAIAALKLGAASALAIDNDPQALSATADNAERNAVGERLQRLSVEAGPQAAAQVEPAEVMVANILAGPLAALAPDFARLTCPGGRLAISGILAEQEAGLLERYAEWFDELQAERREDWVRISGRRRHDA